MSRTIMQSVSMFVRSREEPDRPTEPPRPNREDEDKEGTSGGGNQGRRNHDSGAADLPGDGGTHDR